MMRVPVDERPRGWATKEWTEGKSRGSLCFVRKANFCIGSFHDSNAKTLGSNKVRHADGPPYHPPLWL